MILLQASSADANIINIIFIVGLVAVFYFFMIRPQQKKQKQQKEFSEALKKGDNVVTVGGMHGRVSSVEGDTVILEIDRGIKVRFDKTSISFENTNFLKKNEAKTA